MSGVRNCKEQRRDCEKIKSFLMAANLWEQRPTRQSRHCALKLPSRPVYRE